MSRQSKNARNLAKAREFSRIRKEGGRSSSPGPKHQKKNAWWQIGSGSYSAFIKGKARRSQVADVDSEVED
jgi:hypothetical protein